MPHSLRDLYLEELRDIYSAEQQILEALPKMEAAAQSERLRRAFHDHLEQTRVQKERLELIFKQLNESPRGHVCEGMRGLIKEGQERMGEGGASDVMDAALIGAAQRIEHYEMAAYGTARTYARILGDWESERLLQQSLDEEGDTDHRLTHLAQSGINDRAERGDAPIADNEWSRLRYLNVDDMPGDTSNFRDIRVRGRHADDLGALDGFILESATGRPFYYVVDSGGWFVGRRYLVPVGQGQFEAGNRTIQLDLDGEALKRYPEFSTGAFLSMSDDEVRRYERRVLSVVDPNAGVEPRYWESYDRLPAYNRPDWWRDDYAAGTNRSVGSLASRQTDWHSDATGANAPTARGHEALPTVGGPRERQPSRDEDLVVARESDDLMRDPRHRPTSDDVAPRADYKGRINRLDDDDRGR
jgi:ferritin-like metal-binding protein YciE